MYMYTEWFVNHDRPISTTRHYYYCIFGMFMKMLTHPYLRGSMYLGILKEMPT